MKQTESYRLMRGAWEAYYEYILELRTEFEVTVAEWQMRISIVGCDVVAHVTSAGVLSDTYRGKQCELFTKKGGITSFMPRPFTRAGLFYLREEAEEGVDKQTL